MAVFMSSFYQEICTHEGERKRAESRYPKLGNCNPSLDS